MRSLNEHLNVVPALTGVEHQFIGSANIKKNFKQIWMEIY